MSMFENIAPETETETTETETQETQETETQETPESPENPESPESSETPETPESPEDSETPESPEILYADKFKSVSDLEKSYKELQSAFSKKLGAFKGAPEEYQLSDELKELVSEDTFNTIAAWGKDHQMSQEGLEQFIVTIKTHEQQQLQERVSQELQKLGSPEEAQARLQNVYKSLQAQVPEYTEAITAQITSAEALTGLERLLENVQNAKIGSVPEAKPRVYSKEEIEAMRFRTNENGDRLMSIDPEYRKKVLDLEAQYLVN